MQAHAGRWCCRLPGIRRLISAGTERKRRVPLAPIKLQSLVILLVKQCGNLRVKVVDVPINWGLSCGRLPIEDVELTIVHSRVPGSEVAVHDAAADFLSRQLASRPCQSTVTQTPEDGILAVLRLAPSLCYLFNNCQSRLFGWLRVRQLAQKVLVDRSELGWGGSQRTARLE